MRLSPEKCTFKVKGGKFLGFMLSARGIEANRDKCQAVLDMRSPSNLKEMQRLSGRLVALSQFLLRLADKISPMTKLLWKASAFSWNEPCEETFAALKATLATLPILTRPDPSSPLLVYLAVSDEAISSALPPSSCTHQLPIAKVLGKPELAGRMMAWSVELFQFDITFKPRGLIKAQCLADFVNELHPHGQFEEHWWTLHVEGSSNCQGSEAGVILEGPKGIVLEQSLRFRFKASNNQAEYEALLARLRLAEDMGASRIKCLTDSKVVVEQANFQEVLVGHIPREDNTRADQLARLAATKKPGQLRTIIQQEIDHPSFEAEVVASIDTDHLGQSDPPDWRAEIKAFITNGAASTDPTEAKRLRTQASRYVIIADQLYKHGFSTPLLKCQDQTEADYVIREVHEGICGMHSGVRTTVSKLLRAGYYWPTMNTDCGAFVKKSQQCQKHGNLIHQVAEQLHYIPPA
ncbi:uncharacterized protein LOC109789337 [Cajanus cajan]|uniref:uncharacterized protein LOC109789337 n=1 Tax=Cajanus cajan TaxID=3821 RepID=UPI00098D9DA8|nr:uncharacterized protein LOC109789337 [Cajanus cajan]